MRHPSRRQALIALALVPGLLRPEAAAIAQLPRLDDLRVLADLIARHKAPLLVLFSTPGCPFCLEVRRNYLMPRVTEQAGKSTPDLLLCETDITSDRTIVDLSGVPMTEEAFGRLHGVRVVPVVTLFDSSLQRVGEPLVGLDRAGFYEGYLASAIDAARKQLRQTS